MSAMAWSQVAVNSLLINNYDILMNQIRLPYSIAHPIEYIFIIEWIEWEGEIHILGKARPIGQYQSSAFSKIIEVLGLPQNTQKILKVIKWTNIITSIAIIAFGITGLIFIGITSLIGAKFFLVFSPIFMTLFGVVLLATECKLDFVLKRVGFLRTLLGRGIFNIYLASEVFYYFSCGSGDGVLAWVFGVALFGLGVFYIILQFCGGSKYTQGLKDRLSK